MNNHNDMVKEQLIHMLVGTAIFLVLGSIAVGLDLASSLVERMGVSQFTKSTISYAAHGLLLLDLLLFALYLFRSSTSLVKEMFK